MKNPSQLRAAIPAALLLIFGVSGLAAAQVLPAEGDRVAVFAPGHDPLRVVASAGGLAFGGSANAIFAVSDQPGFIGRLYDSGAWLVLRFDGAAGCLQSNIEDTYNERG